MNVEADHILEVEKYLKSFGGLWGAIPDNLKASIRDYRRDEPQGVDRATREAVVKTRRECYEQAIREFARICAAQHQETHS